MGATTSHKTILSGHRRLRASPNFAQMCGFDGRPFVAKDSEPYTQYWLSERYRLLLALFSGRTGATIEKAIAAYFRLTGIEPRLPERRKLERAIRDMHAAEVLIDTRDETSRYTQAIAEAYLTHRPFPPEIAAAIINAGVIGTKTRVLDLAGGPGDLALQLARSSDHVAMMELSRGFVAVAEGRARAARRPLETIHDSCNRLMFRDDRFDVVTVSQALHWLDDVMICRGLCRVLKAGGSFFVVHVAFDVLSEHPLAHLFGHDSVLGIKKPRPFAEEVAALHRRLARLFEALDAPDVDRVDLARPDLAQQGAGESEQPRICPETITMFRQVRPMGLGFARGFLTDRHIAATGMKPEAFWKDVEARCVGASPEEISGRFDWALLHFKRRIPGSQGSDHPRQEVIEIGYHGPPEA